MNAEELVINDGSQRQSIKSSHDCFINIQGILVIALETEREMLGKVSTFVITAQEINLVGIVQLEGQEVDEAFDRKVAAIDVVTKEKEGFVGWLGAGYLEHFNQIIVLTMNITNN